ncbi:EamA-like transporter family protein [Paracoccus isoporae]|uniref:EamA-like transporter family protein n=1 Tax=Paracoccus isoporae TaxID=591205 RepID=A0A1G6Z250_9RHOB|nr:DMT family transporter [Paracoccus isoporae]SDD96017.1 EamA-like transporter family protein [Paracoccus isoporae]
MPNPDRRPATTASALPGIAAMSLAMFLLPAGDALTKSLTSIMDPIQIAAIRAVIQVALLWLALPLLRGFAGGPSLSGWSILSGVLTAVVALSLITAFQTMPIATTIAIFFVEPLLLMLLAGVFLGETPGPRRYAAAAVGLCGTLIILRPNLAEFGAAVILPLIAALAFALNMIVTRKGTRHVSPFSFQLGASVLGMIVLVAAALIRTALGGASPVSLTGLPVWALVFLLASGAMIALTFLLITFAFKHSEASVLAPFQYLEILGAVIVGYLAFGEVLDPLTLLGTVIVLGSGLYVLHREARAGKPAPPAPGLRGGD